MTPHRSIIELLADEKFHTDQERQTKLGIPASEIENALKQLAELDIELHHDNNSG